MARGIGFVPEDRHREGLMLDMTVTENLAMATLDRFRRGILLSRSRMVEAGRRAISSLSIQPPDGTRPVKLLSGGNQQKVLVGKWLNRAPRILILDEPTVGVDVGAKAEIYAILRRERERGAAVLVVSSDLEEVMTIADRIGGHGVGTARRPSTMPMRSRWTRSCARSAGRRHERRAAPLSLSDVARRLAPNALPIAIVADRDRLRAWRSRPSSSPTTSSASCARWRSSASWRPARPS